MFNNTILSIAERVITDNRQPISREEAQWLARTSDKNVIDLLIGANKITSACKKDDIFTCAIINAKSGRCSQDCAFCAQSGHHSTGIPVYPLLEIYNSGITHYHHNLETAESYFDQICTTHPYKEDIETLKIAADAGLFVCSGCIFGLGESWDQRVELAFTLKQLNVPRIPVNFLNPIPGTRLENLPLLSPFDALKCIALLRFIHPQADITICGGREPTLKDYQSWVFMAGANGLMIGNYLTTKGRNLQMDQEMIDAWRRLHKR